MIVKAIIDIILFFCGGALITSFFMALVWLFSKE